MLSTICAIAIITTSFLLANTKALGEGSTETNTTSTTTVNSVVVPEVKTMFTEQEITNLAYLSADTYGVNRNEVLVTVKCEAKKVLVDGVKYYVADAKSDYPGEESYGLAQWNLPSNNLNFAGSAITKAQATDGKYSVDLMAYYFSKGESVKRKWSCYKLNFS